MKKRTRFMVAIMCAAMLLTMVSCKQEEIPEETQPIPQEETALTRYQQICDTVNNAADLTVETQYSRSRTVGGEVYSETFTETAYYHALGTKNAMASVTQAVSFGPYETQYAEMYYKNTAYCKTGDTYFRKDMTIQQFRDHQIPAILVDAALYDTVEVNKRLNSTVITFSEPKALESWATNYTAAVLVSATATATLDKNGELMDTSYAAQYTCDGIVYDLQVKTTVKTEAPQNLKSELAEIDTDCPTLSYFYAPRKILQVVGDVYTATALSAEYTESVYSGAFSRSRSRTSFFDTYGADDAFMARSSYEVINTDYSNTPVTTSEVVVYQDGSCTSSVNGAEPTLREGITAETMRTFCEDAVLAALFTPNHIKNATRQSEKDYIRIDFTGNSAFSNNLCNTIYSIFGANLDAYADAYTTPVASGYLCIDKATGLPTALGIELERIHTAGEISYSLTYQLDQTMQLSSTQAYENITGEPEPTPTEP